MKTAGGTRTGRKRGGFLAAEERFSCGRHFRPRTVELCVLFVVLLFFFCLHLTACSSARKTGFSKNLSKGKTVLEAKTVH